MFQRKCSGSSLISSSFLSASTGKFEEGVKIYNEMFDVKVNHSDTLRKPIVNGVERTDLNINESGIFLQTIVPANVFGMLNLS